MGTGDLALDILSVAVFFNKLLGLIYPDDADLGATDGALGAVDVCYALSGVPPCGGGVIYTLELEERGARVGVALCRMISIRPVAPVLQAKTYCRAGSSGAY